MRPIEIEDDVYRHLLSNATEIGESASSILRRLLDLDDSSSNGGKKSDQLDERSRKLRDFLDSGMPAGRNATARYLEILAFLHAENQSTFDRILAIRGRKRRYFGRSRQEIAASGTSTHPKQIPSSSFWALTNADTAHKREILRQVLDVLGYQEPVASRVVRALR